MDQATLKRLYDFYLNESGQFSREASETEQTARYYRYFSYGNMTHSIKKMVDLGFPDNLSTDKDVNIYVDIFCNNCILSEPVEKFIWIGADKSDSDFIFSTLLKYDKSIIIEDGSYNYILGLHDVDFKEFNEEFALWCLENF